MRWLEHAGKKGWKMADYSVLMAVDNLPNLSATTEWEDRVIVRSAVTAPDYSLSTIKRAIHTRVCTMSIHRRLRSWNVCSFWSLRHMLLKPAHCLIRLQWCLAWSDWNDADWGRIVFSEESHFRPCPHDHSKCLSRCAGQCADPAFTISRHKAMNKEVWSGVPFPSYPYSLCHL